MIGVVVTRTALFMGVDKSKPLKNASILIAMPKSEHSITLPQSFHSILSLGPKKEILQNKMVAPNTLSIIKPKGVIYIGITPLAIVWFNP